MQEMKEIRQEYLTGERPLFKGRNLKIFNTIFTDGESPLKESDTIMEVCLNGNIRSGMRRIFWLKTVHGLRWAVREFGIPTISR